MTRVPSKNKDRKPRVSARKKSKPATPPRKTKRNRNDADASRRLLDIVRQSLDDDQAEDIAVIDLAGKTSFADFMIVASGRNARHIAAMSEHLKEKMKAGGFSSPPMEGLDQSEWVLIDGGDVIIHLFRPEARGLYNLEKMWGGAAWPEPEEPAVP